MPCVDCGLRTGRFCDGCLAAVRVPSGTMPVTEGKLVVVPYTAWKFVLHACQVLGPGNVRKGFVGQSDFMFKVCWQGYTLGAFGIQVWRWKDSRFSRLAFDGYYARKPQTPLAEIESPNCHRTTCL